MSADRATSTKEVEAKFMIPSLDRADAVLSAVQRLGWRVTPEPTRRIRDTYVDTSDAQLGRSGAACRLRCQDDRCFVHVKGKATVTGSVHGRQEWEQELDSPPADLSGLDFGALATEIEALGRATSLDVLVRLDVERRPYDLAGPQGTRVELVFDRVAVSGETGDTAGRFCEVELELKAGDERALSDLAESLRTELGLEPSGMNKLRRALGILEKT